MQKIILTERDFDEFNDPKIKNNNLGKALDKIIESLPENLREEALEKGFEIQEEFPGTSFSFRVPNASKKLKRKIRAIKSKYTFVKI